MARSKEIARGVGRLSRSQVKDRRGFFKGIKTATKPETKEASLHTEKKVGGEKNGGTRLVPTQKASRYYPAEDVHVPKKSRKTARITKLRPSITPGTVLILLAGKYRGKRVVFLKQLESGLLLVTGPFKVNGVPLRRVNQAYVIATSTKLDMSSLKLDEKFNDSYFAKEKAVEKKSAEEEFFEDSKPVTKALPEGKVADQKEVDKVIIESIKKEEFMSKYLRASFGLSKAQYPHLMKF